MKKLLILPLVLMSFQSMAQSFKLTDFLASNDTLERIVDSIFHSLDDDSRVAQLLMPAVGRLGMPEDSIRSLIEHKRIGGVLLLNGTSEQFGGWTNEFNKLNEETGNLPFLYSADAEPSLVNRKMIGSRTVPRANEINTLEELESTATIISEDLNKVGVNYNFAPVVDVSANRTVGYRGFGSKPENIIPYSDAFIQVTQDHNIIATAKHFPGHGLVSGDTHHSLQVINGELQELENYPPLIENGVLSIMIAHIAVKNNAQYATDGLPSTISEKIVTNLLRDSLKFEGLIVTDAMNMGGVSKIENAAVKAVDAGCDIILMPLDPTQAHKDLLLKYQTEQVFKEKVNKAVRRIIRMKVCLGLMDS